MKDLASQQRKAINDIEIINGYRINNLHIKETVQPKPLKLKIDRGASWLIFGSIASMLVTGYLTINHNNELFQKKQIEKQKKYIEYRGAVDSYQLLVQEIAVLLKKLDIETATEHYVAITVLRDAGFFSQVESFGVYDEFPHVEEFAALDVATGKGNVWSDTDFFMDIMRACGFEAYSIKNFVNINNSDNTATIYSSTYHKYVFVWEDGKYKVYDPHIYRPLDITGPNTVKNADINYNSTFNLLRSFQQGEINFGSFIKMFSTTILEKEDEPDVTRQQEISSAYEKLSAGRTLVLEFQHQVFPLLNIIANDLYSKLQNDDNQNTNTERKI